MIEKETSKPTIASALFSEGFKLFINRLFYLMFLFTLGTGWLCFMIWLLTGRSIWRVF